MSSCRERGLAPNRSIFGTAPCRQRTARVPSFLEFPRAGVFLIGTQNRSLIGPLYFSLIGRFTAVIGVFDWPISAGFNWTTKQHNNREKQQKNRRKWRVIKTNNKQQTHTEGKGKMSQNNKARKKQCNRKQEEKKRKQCKREQEKNATNKGTKRQTTEEKHTQRGKTREETREERT